MGNLASDSPPSQPVPRAVWRIDDNGNTFAVRDRLGRAEAERLAIAFAARGHKQTYRDAVSSPDEGAPRRKPG
jgi:hypothetical protein